jgi:hypothetical protein
MIEGSKVFVYLIVAFMFMLVGAMPVWNYILAYEKSLGLTYCQGAIPIIETADSTIPMIFWIAIGAASFQIY